MLRLLGCVLSLSIAASAAAQTPQPFPRPPQKQTQPPPTAPSAPPPSTQAPAPRPAAPAAQTPAPPTARQIPGVPSEAELGAPLYPSAEFLTSYDAGRGQRFYIFGSTVPYADLVNFYKTVLKNRGDELFQAPPTHFFETSRFRDESMAFAPSVTIKDFTFGGSAGYPNPKKDGTPARYPTVIQIVPAPKF